MSITPDQSLGCQRRFFIQMSGPPGSGKSTTATSLAPLIDGVILDHDVIRSSLLEDGIPFAQAAKAAYRLQWTLAEAMLKQKKNVIIDSPCNYQESIDQGTTITERYGYEYWYIECKTDDFELLDERLRRRVPLRSQRTGVCAPPRDASVNDATQRWTKQPYRPKHNVIFVDATGDLGIRQSYLSEQIGLGH